MKIPALINQFDIEQLKRTVTTAEPFPFFQIDNFLSEEFANSVLASYPSYGDALKEGKSFNAVNEKGKVQLTDSSTFAPPVRELNDVLASQ
jgi:glycyl-tRNA synthetase alpha subunit